MTSKEVPCYKCNNRHVGCHGSCKRYVKFNADRKKILRKQQAQAAANHEVSSHWCYDSRCRRIA